MKGLADDELPEDAPVRVDVHSDFDFTVLKLDWPLKYDILKLLILILILPVFFLKISQLPCKRLKKGAVTVTSWLNHI